MIVIEYFVGLGGEGGWVCSIVIPVYYAKCSNRYICCDVVVSFIFLQEVFVNFVNGFN